MLLGFDRFFDDFHGVFFEGDSWRFARGDTLLRIYPERFWERHVAGDRDSRRRSGARRGPTWLVLAAARSGGHDVIALEGAPGRPLLIGHRGAAALAPENTLRAFRAAVALGVDLVEFDVLDLPRGPLIVAHSDHLDEVSHGRAHGSVRSKSLPELVELAPELPTLVEALSFFAEEAPHVGLHVDLKLSTRLDELAAAIVAHGLVDRCVVSGRGNGEPQDDRPPRAGDPDRADLPRGAPVGIAASLAVAARLAHPCRR